MVSVENYFFFFFFSGKNLANEATWIIKSWRKSGRELEEIVAELPSFSGSKHVLKRKGEGEIFSPKYGGMGRKQKNKTIRSKLNSWSTLVEVGKDLFELASKDYCSLWTNTHTHIQLLHTTVSRNVITCCKLQFAHHSVQDELIIDNGPQFTSGSFW